jgi:TolB-like protein/class 3 adenylate cyclase/Tfp pilus assembly protein PilF
MSSVHHLAAIMFVDIVGYTAMMQHDEDLAMNKLHCFKERLVSTVGDFKGEIIQFYGDGCLLIFQNSADAVGFARALQLNFRKTEAIPVRIGIHLGEYLAEEGNIFGDSVNIASRIESMGVPGAILLSHTIKEQIRNKPEIKLTSLGNFEFKNVDEPIEVFALASDDFPVPSRDSLIGKFKDHGKVNSIAVLPFANLSNDPDQEYFNEGITEEIINSLAHISQLRVAGKTSSFYFKNKNIDIRIIGKKLNVSTVLEGSVRRQKNKLRITAQLINVEDGYHLWSERYDRELNDIFAIQDEIALAITEKLKVSLLKDEKVLLHKKPTEHTLAYDLYLRGRFYMNKRGEWIKRGLEYFQKAIELDAEFALAYSGIAEACSFLGFYGMIPPNIIVPKARQNAEKAILLDPSHEAGITTLAFINTFYERDWEKAKSGFLRALALNPNYPPAHYYYSYYLSFVEGQFDESIKIASRATDELEPFVSLSHHILSIIFLNAGKFEEGVRSSQMAIELDPESFLGYRGLGLNLAKLGQFGPAIEALKKAVMLSARHPMPMVELSWVYSLAGRLSDSKQLLNELLDRSKTEFISGLLLCGAAYYCQQYDEAERFLNNAFEQQDETLPCMNAYPPASFIKEDERFRIYWERMKFPANNASGEIPLSEKQDQTRY